MAPSQRKRQLLFSSFLLAGCFSAVASLLRYGSELQGGHALVDEALVSMVSGPLHGQNLLLITDDPSQEMVDMSRVGSAASTSLTPIILTSPGALTRVFHPAHHTQGTRLAIVFLFQRDPTGFLLLLPQKDTWRPTYLVLVCLNSSLNTTEVLAQAGIQRSEFIFLLEFVVHAGKPRLFTSTSLPTLATTQGHSLLKAPLGVWEARRFSDGKALFPPRFDDFGGQVLDVSMVCYDEPFLYYNKTRHCVGSNLDALRIIGRRLNFRFILSSPDAIVFGYKENGTWTGMLGQLMYERKDISVNVLQPSPDRASDFDYTYPYWDDGFAFMLRVPPLVPQWKNILYPFSTLVWALVIATMVAVGACLALLLHCFGLTHDPISVTLRVAGGLVNQPMKDSDTRAWWARLWLLGWWVAVDILAAGYMSNLVAVLTVPVYPKRINTIYELAQSDIIPSMLDYGDFVPGALKTSKNPTLYALGQRLYLDKEVSGDDLYGRLVDLVLGGHHALTITVDYLIFLQHDRNITDTTYLMHEEIYKGYMSWFLPRHTPYTHTISYHLQRLLETGVMAKLYHTHQGSLTKEKGKVRGDGVLNLKHIQGAFILLGLGTVTALLTLLFERLK